MHTVEHRVQLSSTNEVHGVRVHCCIFLPFSSVACKVQTFACIPYTNHKVWVERWMIPVISLGSRLLCVTFGLMMMEWGVRRCLQVLQ